MSYLESNTRRLALVPNVDAVTVAVTTAAAEAIATAAHPERVPALSSLTGDFLAYHRANPRVYTELRRIAREYIAATGADKVGAQQLIEAFRWRTHMETRSADFKINNNFAAFYARALDWFEADLRGKFQMRRSDEADAWIRGYQQQAIRSAQRAA